MSRPSPAKSQPENVYSVRSMDHGNGARAWHDRSVRVEPGPLRRNLLWCELVRLRHARRERVQDFYQRAKLDCRSEAVRSEFVREVRGRRVHRAAEFIRACAVSRIFPDSAECSDGDSWQV